MRVLPRRRWLRVLVVIAAVLVVTSIWWWQYAVFAFKLVVPGPVYERADRRTSDEADLTDDDVALPVVVDAPHPVGDDPSIEVERVLEIANATALSDPPGPGPVYVTTQGGRLLAADLETGTFDVLKEFDGDFSSGGEKGLLGVAVDPDGDRIYLDYTNGKGDVEIRSWPIDDLDGDGVRHLKIGQPFANHNGGNLVFGPDGALWIGTGDGGGVGDRGNAAQDPDTLLGKMLRVVPDPDGGVRAPASNGAETLDRRREIWAIGLRNPWRYSFDRATNELWVADVGQFSIEEATKVDPASAGGNFGWKVLEGTNPYSGDGDPSFLDPELTYDHGEGCSIAGGHVYRGDPGVGLYGWYVFGDYCGGWIRAVPSNSPGRLPVELASELGQVRAFGELDDGELVVLLGDGVYALRPT